MNHITYKITETIRELVKGVTTQNLYRAAAIGVMGVVLFAGCYVSGSAAGNKGNDAEKAATAAGAKAMFCQAFEAENDTAAVSEGNAVVTTAAPQPDTTYGYTNLGIAQAD